MNLYANWSMIIEEDQKKKEERSILTLQPTLYFGKQMLGMESANNTRKII